MSRQSKDDKRSAMTQPIFTWTMSKMFTVRDVFNGRLGDVPLFLAVSSGFYRNSSGPRVNHMEHFETGELLFAFLRAFQRRVLLHDSQGRTLSLPQLSPILFRANGEEKATTLDDVVKTMTLPVRLSFAQKEDLDFIVDRSYKTHEYFGDLTLVSVYLEPFMCCLSIRNEDGRVTNKVVALPCRMRQLGISLVDGIRGESGRQEKFRGLLKTYGDTAENEKFSLSQDPFFKELAFVSRKATIMKEMDIPDYIDEDTFIDIRMKSSRQQQDDGHLNAQQTSDLKGPHYETLWPQNRESHIYVFPQSHADALKDFSTDRNLKGTSSTLKINTTVKTEQPVFSSSRNIIAEPHPKAYIGVSPPIPCRSQVVPSTRDVDSESATKALVTPPPPLPNRPRVAPSSRDATPTSSKAPALPPVSHRVPLRYTSTGEASKNPHTSTQPSELSRPNLSHDQAMSGSARPAKGNHFNIEGLSVDDVCRRLKDIGLEKHCKKFKKSLIDGKLLKRITRKALEEDFGLSEVEIVKLSAFIEEGHIPH